MEGSERRREYLVRGEVYAGSSFCVSNHEYGQWDMGWISVSFGLVTWRETSWASGSSLVSR